MRSTPGFSNQLCLTSTVSLFIWVADRVVYGSAFIRHFSKKMASLARVGESAKCTHRLYLFRNIVTNMVIVQTRIHIKVSIEMCDIQVGLFSTRLVV